MYNRTANEDGSYSTRCLDCFLTIGASVESATELEPLEAGHFCPEKVLAEITAQKQAEATRR
jgi:hypothetical protein